MAVIGDNGQGEDQLREIHAALRKHNARIELVRTFTHGVCVQVKAGTKKAGALIVPNRAQGQSLGDVLKMLGELAEKEED